MRNIAIFTDSSSDARVAVEDGIFESVVDIRYEGVFDLWQRAYEFFIVKDSTWEFIFSSRNFFLSGDAGETVGLLSFEGLYERVIPFIFDDERLYGDYTRTFFNEPINDGGMLYLRRLDLVGIILEVRGALGSLTRYDGVKYNDVLNSIAMGRVSSLRELSKKVRIHEKGGVSVVCVG